MEPFLGGVPLRLDFDVEEGVDAGDLLGHRVEDGADLLRSELKHLPGARFELPLPLGPALLEEHRCKQVGKVHDLDESELPVQVGPLPPLREVVMANGRADDRGQVPPLREEGAHLGVVGVEHFALAVDRVDAPLPRRSHRLAVGQGQMPNEHARPDVLQQGGGEDSVVADLLHVRRGEDRTHGVADGTLPEVPEAEPGRFFLGKAANDRDAQSKARNLPEPHQADGIADALDLPVEPVEGGIDDLEHPRGQRHVLLDELGHLLDRGVLDGGGVHDLSRHRGQYRQRFQTVDVFEGIGLHGGRGGQDSEEMA